MTVGDSAIRTGSVGGIVMELSPDQAEAVDMIQQWWVGPRDEFRLGGLAGTGKTTIVTQVPTYLKNPDIAFMAPTGKAASVLTRKLPEKYAATTIHQFMYRPMEFHCGMCDGGDHCHGHNSRSCGKYPSDADDVPDVCNMRFAYYPPEVPPQLIVVDESSMVGSTMYEHLKEVGSPILFVGDHGQLSPIDSVGSIMMESVLDVKLERIHRQVRDSPILKLAMMARRGEKIAPGRYGDGVEVLLGSRMARDGFNATKDTLLICYTNAMRKRLNKLMRRGLGIDNEMPVPGDRVVCLKNNYAKGVANGMLGEVLSCVSTGAFYRLHIRMIDNDLDYVGVCQIEQFHESLDARFIRGIDQWTFGYCLTAHKAQGSEADHVIIVQEDKMKYMKPFERRRWLYTAITRAKQRLTMYTPIYA